MLGPNSDFLFRVRRLTAEAMEAIVKQSWNAGGGEAAGKVHEKANREGGKEREKDDNAPSLTLRLH